MHIKKKFIFDNEIYDEEYTRLLVGYQQLKGGGGGGGGFRRLRSLGVDFGDNLMVHFIYDKFIEDKFCIYYDEYLYKFNGFAKYKDMNEFIIIILEMI